MFGSIFLMLLGILINYGLRYNQQQRVMQKAFRKALPSAYWANYNGTPSVVQHVVVEDIHIPSPNNPFGVGSMSAVSGSASVARSWTYNIPERDSEPPVLRLEIDGATSDYQLAGFRSVYNITEAKIDKYKLIYGTSNIDDIGKTCLQWDDEDEDGNPRDREDPIYTHERVCLDWSYNIRIIDSCAGAIMNYDSAAARCRLILDKELCRLDCFDDPAATPEECAPCNEDIEIPWYCETNSPVPNAAHQYNFVKLNQLFSFSPLGKEAQMGLQPDYTETFTSDNVLRKQEGPANIVTTSQVDWTSTKTRQVIYRQGTSGSVSNQAIPSPVTRQKTTTWTTPHQSGGTGGTGGGGGTGGTGGGGDGGDGDGGTGGTGGTGGETPPVI